MSSTSTFAARSGIRIPAPALVIPLVAIVASFAVGFALMDVTGSSISDAIAAFAQGAFGSPYAIGTSLNRAIALGLVGLGFILAERANLINVGGEGQIAMGGIFATAVALYGGVAGLPFGLSVLLPVLAGTLAAAAWGALAGLMKIRFGTNEVISTLLLNFIALLLVYWSVQSVHLLRQPATFAGTLPQSLSVPDSTELPLLTGDPSDPIHIGAVVAIILAIITAIVLRRSAFGLKLKAIGLNPLASRRAGIRTNLLTVLVLGLSGAFGGLAGTMMLLGNQDYLTAGFSSGYGFDGLVVGLLSRGSVLGVVAVAIFFGFLRSGGISMQIAAHVPAALVTIVQGIIVVAIAGSAILIDRTSRRA
ncbi:MAG TPA: ABC transporter permease [Xanthobacteraceae bacterium]|nr:ABC transporter permease [Xanthobacteraceae bacterium]